MEVVSSVIAITSIAIQLIDSITKLLEILESIQDAPDDIEDIQENLRILCIILDEIRSNENKYSSSASTVEVLKHLEQKIKAFTALLIRYELGFGSKSRAKRKWSAVKAAFKSKKFETLAKSVDRTKSTLSLA